MILGDTEMICLNSLKLQAKFQYWTKINTQQSPAKSGDKLETFYRKTNIDRFITGKIKR